MTLYCKRQNHNARWAHEWFEHILGELSIPKVIFQQLVDEVEKRYEERLQTAKGQRTKLKMEYNKLCKKLEEVEERYLNNKIEEGTYRRWYRKYENQMVDVDYRIREVDGLLQGSKIDLRTHVDLFADLNYTWQQLGLGRKNAFASLVFNNQLYLCKGVYRTPWEPLLLLDKNQKIKYLDIKEKGKLTENPGQFPLRTRDGYYT
ncbi:MAG: hypothetical protein AAFU57_18090 [Bacteroidota bacterium]